MKKLLAIFVVFMISAGLGLMYRLGVWKDVQVEAVEKTEQPTIFLEHIGAYHKMNDTIIAVETELSRNGHSCALTFGHYIDSPEHQDEDRLRSQGGCLVTSSSLLKQINSKDLKAGSIPKGRYLQGSFDGSPSITPLKVYPKIKEYAAKHQLRLAEDFYEIYEIRGQHVKTTYLVQILDKP